MKKQYPNCEVCKQRAATSFSWFMDRRRDDIGVLSPSSGTWKFTCDCTVNTEDYYVTFDSFFSGPEDEADWLRQLKGKIFMNWDDWNSMMIRFRGEE